MVLFVESEEDQILTPTTVDFGIFTQKKVIKPYVSHVVHFLMATDE